MARTLILLLLALQGYGQTVLIRNNYLWGLKDLDTGFETPAKYLTMEPVDEFGYSQASDENGQALVHTSGKEYRLPKFSKPQVWSKHCYSYTDNTEIVFKSFDDSTYEYRFSNIQRVWLRVNGRIARHYQVKQLDGLYGLANSRGEIVLQPTFQRLTVQGNLIFAHTDEETVVLSSTFDTIRTIPYDRYEPSNNGDFKVFLDDRTGLVNSNFETIVPPRWKNYYPLPGSELYVVYNDVGRSKLFHVGNQRIIYKKSFSEAKTLSKSLVHIENEKKHGLISTSGRIIVPDTLKGVWKWSEDIAVCQSKKAVGAINKRRKIIIPFVYDRILTASNIALVYKNDSTGIINTKGEFIIPLGVHRIERNANTLRRKEGDITYLYTISDAGSLVSKREYKNLHVLKVNKYTSTQKFTNLADQIKIDEDEFEDISLTNRLIDKEQGIYLELRGGGNSHYLYDLKKRKALTGSVLRYFNLYIYKNHKYTVVGVGPSKSFPISRSGFMLRVVHHDGRNIRITDADPYFNDLCVVTTYDKKKGIIDRNGKIIISPKYLDLRILNENFVAVRSSAGWGVMDLKEKTIVPPKFSKVSLNNTENPTAVVVTDYANKYGFVDSLGHERSFLNFDRTTSFSEDRMPVKFGTKWSYTTPDGDTSIAAILQRARPYSQHLAAARLNNKWGYLDLNGEWKIEPQFTTALEFGDDLAPAKISKEGYGYIDMSGRYIIQPKFQRALPFHHGIAIVKHKDKYGLIDTSGKFVLKPKYIRLTYDKTYEAYIGKKKKQKYQYVHTDGSVPMKGYSKKVKLLGQGFYATKDKYYYEVYRSNGSLVENADQFSVLYPFRGTNICAKTSRYWTVLDTSWTNVVGEFSSMKDFDTKGEILAKRRRFKYRIQFIDNQPVVTNVDTYVNGSGSYLGTFDERELYFLKEYETEKLGLRDQSNNTLLGCKYDKIGSFENGYASVMVEGRKGLWSIQGEEICEPIYERIQAIGTELFMIEGVGKVAYVNTSGKWVIPFDY